MTYLAPICFKGRVLYVDKQRTPPCEAKCGGCGAVIGEAIGLVSGGLYVGYVCPACGLVVAVDADK